MKRTISMNTKRFYPFIVVLCMLAPVFAQTPQKPQDDGDVVRVKSNLVNIDVIVKDKKGKYVSDLKAGDFTISENGLPQKIEFFDAPLSKVETRSSDSAAVATGTSAPETVTRNYVSLVLDSQTTDLTN